MKGLLKGYYWYKNLGDEILLLGVINRIFENYKLDKLDISCGDHLRLRRRVDRNKDLIWDNFDKLDYVAHKKFGYEFGYDIKFFGWWEVLTEQRTFPHNGYNLLIGEAPTVLMGKYVILWWIWTPTKFKTKALYRSILPFADKIVVREKKSFEIAQKYNKNTVLHNDFAYDIFQKIKIDTKKEESAKLFVNINQHIYNETATRKIMDVVYENRDSKLEKYYVPCDMEDDAKIYHELKVKIDDLKYYNWTRYTVKEILEFFATADLGVGARLHFLLLLHWLGKKTEPLFYQEKINKFFDDKPEDKKDEPQKQEKNKNNEEMEKDVEKKLQEQKDKTPTDEEKTIDKTAENKDQDKVEK